MNIVMNSPEYWDQVYAREIKEGIEQRDDPIAWDFIIDYIKEGDTVLDFGCGRGQFLEYLLKRRSVIAYGVDHSITGLDEAKKRNDKILLTFKIPDIKFDCITCLHVVEHFEKPEELISLLKDHLKKDGILIIQIPLEDKWKEHIKVWHKEDIENLFKNFDCNNKIFLREHKIIPPYTSGLNPTNRYVELFRDKNKTKLCIEVIIITKFER